MSNGLENTAKAPVESAESTIKAGASQSALKDVDFGGGSDLHNTASKQTENFTNEQFGNVQITGMENSGEATAGAATVENLHKQSGDGTNQDNTEAKGEGTEKSKAEKAGSEGKSGEANDKAPAEKAGSEATTGEANDKAPAEKAGSEATTGEADDKAPAEKAGSEATTGEADDKAPAEKAGSEAKSGAASTKAQTDAAGNESDKAAGTEGKSQTDNASDTTAHWEGPINSAYGDTQAVPPVRPHRFHPGEQQRTINSEPSPMAHKFTAEGSTEASNLEPKAPLQHENFSNQLGVTLDFSENDPLKN